MIFLLLFLIAVIEGAYLTTKNLYNGTVSYSVFVKECQQILSHPCTKTDLLLGFWKESIPTSWIFTTHSCLGYTSDSSYVDGTCVINGAHYTTSCSCNEKFPLLCYHI